MMYCPNCGVEIHEEGAFCAKCRKDVTYLTRPEESEEAKEEGKEPERAEAHETAENVQPKEPAVEKAKARPEKMAPFKPKKNGYYCNHCGTFLYPEDNFCYDCGKTTRKKYYPLEKQGGGKLHLLAAAGLIVLLGVASACLYWYMHAD